MESELRSYLFGRTTRQLVYKGLDAATQRSRAIAQNTANANTPGYQRKEVSFEEQVREAMQKRVDGRRTDEDHLEIGRKAALKKVEPRVYMPNDPTLPGEINNVDIDLEASKMAENQIHYHFLLRFAGFDRMLSAVKGSAQ